MSTRTAHRTRDERRRTPSKYDLFLAVLPVPLLLGFVGAAATSAPLSTGAGLGSLPSAVLLAYGLFVDGPSTATDNNDGLSAGGDNDNDARPYARPRGSRTPSSGHGSDEQTESSDEGP